MTPMMAQFFEHKEAYADALLFFRMGDFYELFFDDAVVASAALDIALTKRGHHKGEDIPMCGVPVHSADAYLSKLIETNFKDNLKCLKRNMNRKFVNKIREMVGKLSDSESEEELLVIPEYDGIEQIHLYYDSFFSGRG